MGKKLIFLDIDGTLTPPGTNVPPESAMEAIRKAQKNGHKVLLCTGRNPAMLKPLLAYGFDGFVGSAGGYIQLGETVVYDHPMTKEQTETAIRLFQESRVYITLEAKDATYTEENIELLLSGNDGEDNSEMIRLRKAISDNLGMIPLKEYDGRPLYKIVFVAKNLEQLENVRAALEEDFYFLLQEAGANSSCINGEIINRSFDKGRGVKRVCDYLEVPVEDTIGFGDSMNDLEMLQVVGTSVCMGNGANALKEISSMVCGNVEEDGLAEAFEKLGLI